MVWDEDAWKEHLAQQEATLRNHRKQNMFGLPPAELKKLIDRPSGEVTSEDCAFLWSCGIRADKDIAL